MTPSELMHSSSSLSSESFVDEDDDKSEGFCGEEGGIPSPISSKGKKTTEKRNGHSASSRFSFLSRKGFIIGLPKVPDTRFKRQDFAARIRCRLTGKGCKKPSVSFIPKEALENSRVSGNRSGGINSFKTYEPGSPDVSCIGRIKQKQKEVKKLKTLNSARRKDLSSRKFAGKGMLLWLKKLFNSGSGKVETPVAVPDSRGASSDHPQNLRDLVEEDEESFRASVPRLSDLKRFASLREPSALLDSRGAGSDNLRNVRGMVDEEDRSRASVPRLSDLKRFSSQREPAALSDLVFQDSDAREQQQPVAVSGDDPSARVKEVNFLEINEIIKKLCEDSEPAEEEGLKKEDEKGLKKEMAYIDVHSNRSQFDTAGVVGSARTPPCEINLWKRRSVAAPRALALTNHPNGLHLRNPLTV